MTETVERIKTRTSHTGLARYLATCDDTPYVIVRRPEIASPYAYSPTWTVYACEGRHIVIVETKHTHDVVFGVPSSLLQLREAEVGA